MKYVEHIFRPTETITSVIKLLGRHDYTHEQIELLLNEFNRINDKRIPRVGDPFKVPVLD